MKKEEINCQDINCPFHGSLKTRGKSFKGTVVNKNKKRVAIEFERMVYIKKYERYLKTKTKIHARVPECAEDSIKIGDFIRIKECRPLSKIIHFVFVEKLNSEGNKK